MGISFNAHQLDKLKLRAIVRAEVSLNWSEGDVEMDIKGVSLDYATDSACLSYACALAIRLGVELIVRYTPPNGTTMKEPEVNVTEDRIRSEILSGHGKSLSALDVRVLRQGDIKWPMFGMLLVANSLTSHSWFPVWRPSAEVGVRNKNAPVLIPFGNKPKLEHGYRFGVVLARDLNVPAVFYHTTWPKDGVVSEDPKDHWHDGAEEVARQAESYAQEMGVPHEVVVEIAPNVREGVHRAALLRSAMAIVVQQDANVIAGGYHDELIRYGHLVPLVILPRGGV